MKKKFIYRIITTLFILSINLYSNTIATYKVKRGDTLFGIAFSHNMNVDTFLKVNNIENYKNYSLKIGNNLKVYEKTTSVSPSNITKTVKTNSKTTTYKVKRGDTLSGVAEKYGMGLGELYKLNNMDSKYNLKVDDSLKVYKKMTTYKVKSGDTLSEIAEKYNMGLGELYELNDMDSKYNLKVDDSLKVYKNNNNKTAIVSPSNITKTVKTNGNKTTYKVKRGDTLFGIAFSHNMSVDAFLKINNIKDYKKYTLKVGSSLNVYKGEFRKTANTTKTKSYSDDTDGDTVTYRVKKGDTLSEIALAHNMDIIDIYTMNNLSDKHVLQIDAKLKVYNKSRILYTKTMTNYKVKNGDSLYGLARTFGMNINELSSLNNIKNINTYSLLIGSNIKVYETKAIVRPSANRIKKVVLPKSSFAWPYLGSIAVGYGVKSDKVANRGINIVAKYGDKVAASDEGVVEYSSLVRGYGMVVIIRHKNDYTTSYAHLSDTEIKVGDRVSKGDKIGSIGKTGFIEDYELYFKINYKGRPVNPVTLLPKG